VDVFSDVWQVEKTRDVETFSNGLHIDDRYAVSNDPRVPYPVFGPIGTQSGLRTQPAGIVYHTTESDQASFEENQNGALKKHRQGSVELRQAQSLLPLPDRPVWSGFSHC
jgi:hypothetical protein